MALSLIHEARNPRATFSISVCVIISKPKLFTTPGRGKIMHGKADWSCFLRFQISIFMIQWRLVQPESATEWTVLEWSYKEGQAKDSSVIVHGFTVS